jgi:hypothetical protein
MPADSAVCDSERSPPRRPRSLDQVPAFAHFPSRGLSRERDHFALNAHPGLSRNTCSLNAWRGLPSLQSRESSRLFFRFLTFFLRCSPSAHRLPRWYPQHQFVFVTWHLYDSFPQPSAGQTFIWMDGYTDAARRVSGPLYLGQEVFARLLCRRPSITAHSNGHHDFGNFRLLQSACHRLALSSELLRWQNDPEPRLNSLPVRSQGCGLPPRD